MYLIIPRQGISLGIFDRFELAAPLLSSYRFTALLPAGKADCILATIKLAGWSTRVLISMMKLRKNLKRREMKIMPPMKEPKFRLH